MSCEQSCGESQKHCRGDSFQIVMKHGRGTAGDVLRLPVLRVLSDPTDRFNYGQATVRRNRVRESYHKVGCIE